jgi:hypothetical protein
METIYLDSKQVPSYLRGSYSGKQFKAVLTDSFTIPNNAGLWDGGSRETFRYVRLSDGSAVASPNQSSAPWSGERKEIDCMISPEIAVVCHSMFCGKDMGLTFYIHPDAAQKLLPAPSAELSDIEKRVLKATREYKASYNGMNRYQMAKSYAYGLHSENFPTIEQWEEAKTSLIAKGLLNKAGAITVSGRNAI